MGEQSSPRYPSGILRVSIADILSLNVRTKGSRGRDLPQMLYQHLPEKAMTLIATVPPGNFPVSIPGNMAATSGCPIFTDMPEAADGLVVVYKHNTNGRYEAGDVQYRNKSFAFREFITLAHRWVEENVGRLKAIPGRYGHFVPSIEEWGVILRDNGYVAWDPSGMPAGASLEFPSSRQAQDRAGVWARIPVFAGDKRPEQEILPVFAQVDVLRDANRESEPDWISYAEYLRIQSERGRLPDAILPDFQNWLRQLTEESGFKRWIFRPGMFFGDHSEWWGDGCRRRTEHEGVDFALGLLPGGEVRNIPEGVPVRALAKGEVAAVLADFLGKTVVVRHPTIARPNGDIFHTLLSHIRPQVRPSDSVAKGQIVGTIGKETRSTAPCHLHLTGAWIPEDLSDEIRMDWIHPGFAPVALTKLNGQLQSNPLCSLEIPEDPELIWQ